ncbi:MAG: hypothetical protein GXO81_09345 [Chlorobi bacterium]|nr:hypothetical protein [Chlorobiota bacterium]
MKTKYLLSLSLMLLFAILMSCQKEQDDVPATGEITGVLIGYTGCKQNKSALSEANYNKSVSCVTYSYDSESKILALKHINAGFNCCPDSLYCSIVTSGDTIIISEFEKAALCRCNCLFDLDIELDSVASENYIIKINEPYCAKQEELIFEIDLNSNQNGEYCVDRDIYPWGI